MSGTALSNFSGIYSEKVGNKKVQSGKTYQKPAVGADDMSYKDMLSSFMEDDGKKSKNNGNNSRNSASDNAATSHVAARSTGNTLGLELLNAKVAPSYINTAKFLGSAQKLNENYTLDEDGNVVTSDSGEKVKGWIGINGKVENDSEPQELTVKPSKTIPAEPTHIVKYSNNVTLNVPVITELSTIVKQDNNKLGDLNGDGKISLVDISRMDLMLNGEMKFSKDELANADMNKDGNVDKEDAKLLDMKFLGYDVSDKEQQEFDYVTATIENPIRITMSDGSHHTVTSGTYYKGASMPIVTSNAIYDSLGVPRNIPLYITKTANTDNGSEWTISLNQDMSQNTKTLYGEDGNNLTVQMDYVKLYFDTKGNYDVARNNSATMTITGNGIDKQEITVDFSKVTQYAGESTIHSISDGIAAGKLKGVSINEEGEVISSYSNGVKLIEGKIFHESNFTSGIEADDNNDKQNIENEKSDNYNDNNTESTKKSKEKSWEQYLEAAKLSRIQKACDGILKYETIDGVTGKINPKNGEFNFGAKTGVTFHEGDIIRVVHADEEYNNEYIINCSEQKLFTLDSINNRSINISSNAKINIVANNKEEVAEINALNNHELKLRIYGSDFRTIKNGEIVNTKEVVKTVVNGSGNGDNIEIDFYSGEVYYNATNGDKESNIKIYGSGGTYSNGDKRAKAGHAHMYVDKGENILTIENSNDVDIVSGGRNKLLLKNSSINIKNLSKNDTIIFGWNYLSVPYEVNPDEIEIEEDENHNLHIHRYGVSVMAYGEWSYDAKILTSEGEKSIGDIISERIKKKCNNRRNTNSGYTYS